MKILISLPDADSPGVNKRTGKPLRDWSGAFRPEASRAAVAWRDMGHDVVTAQYSTSATLSKRAEQSLEIFRSNEHVGMWAHFGHGWPSGLQCGLTLKTLAAFAKVIRATSPELEHAVWYSCSAASSVDKSAPGGDGGIADAFRDELGVSVDAHTTAGHTTRNPYVRRFERKAGEGGTWIIDPKNTRDFSTWRSALNGPVRFAFPLLSLTAARSVALAP